MEKFQNVLRSETSPRLVTRGGFFLEKFKKRELFNGFQVKGKSSQGKEKG